MGYLFMGSFDKARIERIAGEIQRVAKARQGNDVIVSADALKVSSDSHKAITLQVPGRGSNYNFRRESLYQLAAKTDVPVRWLDRLTDNGHADMAASDLSELLKREGADKRFLLRLLDGEVDAVLSDRYRCVANDDILAVTLQEIKRVGAEIWDFRYDRDTFSILAVAPHISGQVDTRRERADNGADRWIAPQGSDVHNPVVRLSNSETGHGKDRGDIASLRRICMNLAVHCEGYASVHLGRRHEEEGEVVFSAETRKLEAETQASKVRDMFTTAFDKVKFQNLIDRLNKATTRSVEGSPVRAVEVAIRVLALPVERKDAILAEFLGTKDLTQYGLAQAITAQVNPKNAGTLSDSVRSSVEEAGGKLLDLETAAWRAFLRTPLKGEAVEVRQEQTVSVISA